MSGDQQRRNHGSIYYPFACPAITGGDFVNIDHIDGLNKLGFNAKVLYCAADTGMNQFRVPVADVRATLLTANDIVVIGENQRALFAQLHAHPCRKILHNQNPYYTFAGFDDIQSLNAYPLDHVIASSDFCIRMLRQMGLTKPASRIRPAIPDYFAPGRKQLQIAFSPRKRPEEAMHLRGYFRTQYPEYVDVPWIDMFNVSREECARIMARSAIYVALAKFEGLGLMNIEAMASGCHVIGYTGNGGSEYATQMNGDWIDEGDYAAFAEKIASAIEQFTSQGSDARVSRGAATAALFSRDKFAIELHEVWLRILGSRADAFRK